MSEISKYEESIANKSYKWYKTVLDTINEGVILQAESGEILAVNKGAENILGIPEEEFIGRNRRNLDFLFIHEDGTNYEVKDYPSTKTLQTCRPFRNEIMGIYRSKDDLRWISVNTNPLFKNSEYKPYAVVISFSDITELKVEKDTSQNYLDIAGVIIVALNSEGVIELINRKGCVILGGTEDELLGRNWFDLFTPKHELEDVKKYYQEIMSSHAQDERYSEYKILNLSGDEKIIAWNHTYLRDKDGKIIGSLSSGEDITEKKRAEEELARHMEFERLIGKISSDLLKLRLKDLDKGIENALASIGSFAGVDRAYVFLFHKDDDLADNTHEWCAEGIVPQIENLKGISVGEELPWFDKHIQMRDVFKIEDISAMPQEAMAEREHFAAQGIQSIIVVPMSLEDRLLGFLGFDAVTEKKKWSNNEESVLSLVGEVFTNAIDRKWAEEELQESEKRWQFALEGAGDGVWDWNAETNKVYFSRRWKEMLGFSENEIVGTLDEWDSRVHPDDIDSVYADLNAHFNGESDFYQNEHRVLCKDGSYKWILDRGKVIEWTGDGKPLRVIGLHSDITDRKKWEFEREKLITELKDALDQVNTLSGLLPICSNCKKIRDDKGYWNQIETYIHEHSQAQFSHSICPDCAKKLYPDFNE